MELDLLLRTIRAKGLLELDLLFSSIAGSFLENSSSNFVLVSTATPPKLIGGNFLFVSREPMGERRSLEGGFVSFDEGMLMCGSIVKCGSRCVLVGES